MTKPTTAILEDTDKKLWAILDSIFAYGIDWTEYREKQETGDHDVATYAGKIKAEFKEKAHTQISNLLLEARKEEIKDAIGWEPYNDNGELYDLTWYLKDRQMTLEAQLKAHSNRGDRDG